MIAVAALASLLALMPPAGPSPHVRPQPALPTAGARWEYPLAQAPRLVAAFDPPGQRWLAGHRGIDLAGTPGASVTAVADGVVVFSGRVAGIGVVSVLHADGTRSTYQPISPSVDEGVPVARGEVIGTLEREGSHCPGACLHLGARRAGSYVDPVRFFGPTRVRLLPYLE